MVFGHFDYRPYQVGSRVRVEDGHPRARETGTVTWVEPPGERNAQAARYYVTFDGESKECDIPFTFFALYEREV